MTNTAQIWIDRCFEMKDENADLRARIAELKAALDAFHNDPDNLDSRVLRYKAIASKAINEQVEMREKYEALLSDIDASLNELIHM